MNICALIVTYNRLDKLKICLSHYENQIMKPTRLLIVDNCSNKETYDFLEHWLSKPSEIKKTVLHLDKNYGGSGGFYYGMKKAMELGFDWLWIADDDAYPGKDAFKILNEYAGKGEYQAICGTVYNSNGIDFYHRRNLLTTIWKAQERPTVLSDYSKSCFEINIFSFVGSAISYEVVEKCGYPMKDYFIWYDDTEYSLRVNENFKILCVSSIKIYHDAGVENNSLSWKNYYGLRNQLDMAKRHYTPIQFKRVKFICKLRMAKKFFTDRKWYHVMKDAYYDYKQKKFGVSEKYKPGSKI